MTNEQLAALMKEQFAEVNNRLDGLETKVDRLETKVDGLETKVDGLETKVDGLETKVDGLETKMNKALEWQEKHDEHFSNLMAHLTKEGIHA